MVNNEETPLGQGYEEIIRDDSLDNTNQQLNRHVYSRSGRIDHEITDFILKRADYTNTFIAIDTAGLPNNATLYLVDENSNQLYSPVDANGNWVTTRCSITVGENNIIPLPAQFTTNLASHIPFPAGTYNWKLQYPENEYYFGEEIPLQVEIRDFKIWDILTPQIYPNGDIKIKLKTYGDTLYPILTGSVHDLAYVLTSNATFDVDTGIITYPNQDIGDLSIGKHMQVINQSNNCFIDYEVKKPIKIDIKPQEAQYHHSQVASQNRTVRMVGLKLAEGKIGGPYPVGGLQDVTRISINGIEYSPSINQSSADGTVTPSVYTSKKRSFTNLPPGKYHCIVSGNTTKCNTTSYTDEGDFIITTENCSITLTLEYDNENNAIGHFPNINTLILNNQTISSQANYGINPQRATITIQKQNYQYEYNDIFLNLQLSDKNRINIRPVTENASLIIKNNDNTYTIYPLNTHGYTMIKNDNIITLDLDDNIITVDLTTQYIGLGTNSNEMVEIQIIEVDQISSTLTATYLYNNETPIKNAMIYIKELNNEDIVYTGMTDENGEVKIDWSEGRYQAVVQDAYTNEDLLYSNIIDTENPYLNNITISNSDLIATYGFNTPIDEISINNYGDLILTLDGEVNNIISNVYIGENGELYYRSE